MKIQIASDLHFEAQPRAKTIRDAAIGQPRPALLEPEPTAELLILAGDIHSGSRAFDMFADWPVPIVYVMGNHEAYGSTVAQTVQMLRAASTDRMRFLERASFVFKGVRFVGTTLWTDFELNAPAYPRDEAIKAVRDAYALADFRLIHGHTPVSSVKEHEASRSWLQSELARPFEGPTVAVTHHGVHRLSVPPCYWDFAACAGFVSHMPELLPLADLWVHGHLHTSVDYSTCETRVVSNPRGHWDMFNGRYENRGFRPQMVVDVPV